MVLNAVSARYLLTTTLVTIVICFLANVSLANARVNFRLFGRPPWTPQLHERNRPGCRLCLIAGSTRVASAAGFDKAGDDDDATRLPMRPSVYRSNFDDVFNDGQSARKMDSSDESNKVKAMMSFPYCSGLTVAKCEQLLQHLKLLIDLFSNFKLASPRARTALITVRSNRQQRLKRATQSVVTSGEQSNNSEEGQGTMFAKDVIGQRQGEDQSKSPTYSTSGNAVNGEYSRPVRTSSDRQAENERVLEVYRQWRQANGYGQQNARWGRSTRSAVPVSTSWKDRLGEDVGSVYESINSAGSEKLRQKRSLVVEIQLPSEYLSDKERDMLESYITWREQNGYGALAGRWG